MRVSVLKNNLVMTFDEMAEKRFKEQPEYRKISLETDAFLAIIQLLLDQGHSAKEMKRWIDDYKILKI